MAFDFDIFISYSSHDRAWASRLNDLLTQNAPPLRSFFDRDSLRAGDDWEAKIQSALEQSEHLIALWSPHAKDSDWVQREVNTFYVHAQPHRNPARRLLHLCLSGRSQAYSALHQLELPVIQMAYGEGDLETGGAWEPVERAIRLGLTDQPPLDVPVVLLSLTNAEPAQWTQGFKRDLQRNFKQDAAILAQAYGANRFDWRPFGGDRTIAQWLDEVGQRLGGAIKRPIRWIHPPASFWNDPSEIDQHMRRMKTSGLCLVVVDPVAVEEHGVHQRLMCLRDDCFGRPQTVIVVMPPFVVHSHDALKRVLRDGAKPAFDYFFKPEEHRSRLASSQFVWTANDVDDVTRHLIMAARRCEPTQAEPSPFIGVGGRR